MHPPEEEQPLLPNSDQRSTTHRGKKWITSALQPQCWKAHPYWLVPVAFTVMMSRGVTMAPRIQVFNSIACRALQNASLHSIVQPAADSPYLLPDCSGSEVAARAAKIQAAVITTMSVLSAVTTGFWSRLGDSYGRKPIFIIFIMGAIFMEFVFVLVMRPNTIFSRFAEQLILLGPIVEGLVGANATFNGVLHAYISDCTPHGSRSKIFSTIQGVVSIGLSAGPWLPGLVLPHNLSTDPFFYLSMTTMTITLVYMLALCPESHERIVHAGSECLSEDDCNKKPMMLVIRHYFLKFLAALVSPIVMFAPRPLVGHPEKKSYNVTLVGLAFFTYTISNAVFNSKYLFAQHLYSWTTAQLGYYMSILWIIRAVNLLIILPIIISYLKPKASTPPGTPINPQDLAAELRFDRHLAQASLLLDGASNMLVALTSQNSQIVFIMLSCVSSFTSGSNPALHSLGAVCLHACGYGSDVGTLFGAKAVLSAVAHIISPSIFASTYATTVAYFPQAIFVLASGLIFVSTTLLAGVRASVKDITLVHGVGVEEEEPLNGTLLEEDDEEIEP